MFKLKNRHWWNNGKKYHRINFVIKVNLGPADLSFELWHNGVKLSKDNTIKVEWQAAAPPNLPQNVVANDFPMNSLPAVTNSTAHMAKKSFHHLRSFSENGQSPGSNGNGWYNVMGLRAGPG